MSPTLTVFMMMFPEVQFFPKVVKDARSVKIVVFFNVAFMSMTLSTVRINSRVKSQLLFGGLITIKVDDRNPENRSRLVAKKINTHKDDDLYAATPPIEALKVLLRIAAHRKSASKDIKI